MSFLLDNLFALVYWLAILGGMAWWFWSMRRMRRSAAPPKRTEVENAELARLQAQLEQRPGESGDEKFSR
jgi:hypothetical protein